MSNQEETQKKHAGIDMESLCQTLARVLVSLAENRYTEITQQDTVRQHDALSNPASDDTTREAS
jgi:hypothetical protein